MSDAEGGPAPFDGAPKEFMDAPPIQATRPSTRLLDRLTTGCGAEPTRLPVVPEELDLSVELPMADSRARAESGCANAWVGR